MTFTFINEDGDTRIEHRFDALAHTSVTRGYIDFLRGCGFILPKERGESSFDVADLLKPRD